MYRDNHDETFRHVNIQFDNGGLGDCIARLPAVYYIAKHHKHIQQHLWVPDYFKEFAKNCLKDTNIIIRSFSEKDKYKDHFLARAFSPHKYDNMATHLTNHAFHVLVNKDVEPSEMNYLKPDLSKTSITKFDLPEKYVIMTTGFTANAREFYGLYVNEVNKYIISKGYTVVFLGKKETAAHFIGKGGKIIGAFKADIDYTVGMNLIDKTNLFESTKIIEGAKCLVGLDNGLGHLCGTTETSLVMSYSSVEPKYRIPYRLKGETYPVVPPKSLSCRFCQSNMTFTYDHNFTECVYKDFQCLKQMTPDLYIEQLEKVL